MVLLSGEVGKCGKCAHSCILALEVRISEPLPLELMTTVALWVFVLFVVIGPQEAQLGFKLVTDVVNNDLEL